MMAGAFNPSLHPRAPKGSSGGGEFAKGSAPAPSKKANAKTGGRYSKQQFGQLQSLEKQHAKGKKLTGKQAHALHVAHELHLQHEAAMKGKPKRTAKKTTAGRKKITTAALGRRG